jgi:flagellar protein FlaG
MQVQPLPNTPAPAERTAIERPAAAPQARVPAVANQPDTAGAAPPTGKAVGEAVDSINRAMKTLSNRIEFSIDEDSKRQVVKVIDPDTREVIRQMPSEEALQIAKALDRLQGLLIKHQA